MNTMSLATVGVSRCGEIFVTNTADNWTFCCSYCQKATNDIGVFICHIRIDHLSGLMNSEQENVHTSEESEAKPVSKIHDSNFFHKNSEYDTEDNLLKEETTSRCSFSSKTFCKNSKILNISETKKTENKCMDKNPIATGYPSIEMKDVFTITERDQGVKQEDIHYEDGNNEVDETIAIDDDDNEDEDGDPEADSYSIYSANDESDLTNECLTNFDISNHKIASGSKHKKEDKRNMRHICELCNMNFKFRSELDHHLKTVHNQRLYQKPLKCKQCRKTFRSVAGLKNHLKSHDERSQIQCPICQAKHNQSYFITHVLTHESDTCYPCQVCAKIYANNEERVKHWETHANEMPFECDFCYRRFRKQQYLTHHLKSHFQYQCQFCPSQFNAVESQKPPYLCTKCENLPDIKEKVQKQRLLTNKYQHVPHPTVKPKIKAWKHLKHN